MSCHGTCAVSKAGVSGSPATEAPYHITATLPAAPPRIHGSTHVVVNSNPGTRRAFIASGLVQLAGSVGSAGAGQLIGKSSCGSANTTGQLAPCCNAIM